MMDSQSASPEIRPRAGGPIGVEIAVTFVLGLCLSTFYLFQIQGQYVSWSHAEEHIYLFKFPLFAMLLEVLILTLVGNIFFKKNENGKVVQRSGSKKWIPAFVSFMAANAMLIFGWLSGYMVLILKVLTI